jgi:hypothetical protein
MFTYATLSQFKNFLRQDGATPTTQDDVSLGRILFAATKTIEEHGKRNYGIKRATIYHDYPLRLEGSEIGIYDLRYNVPLADQGDSSRRLRLTAPLLELESVVNGNGDAIALTSVNLYPTGLSPARSLYLKSSTSLSWLADDDGDDIGVIPVTGVWGYHEDYSSAYVDSDDTVVDNPLSDTSTVLEVNNADGAASDFDTPRFQVGQILRLTDGTDYEFVFVKAIDPQTNELTISRGYAGTVAAEWSQSTPIEIFRPMWNVMAGCMEISKLIYRRKDRDSSDVATILGTGIRIEPKTLPEFITDMLPTPDQTYVFGR